jgi:hypothetical protein
MIFPRNFEGILTHAEKAFPHLQFFQGHLISSSSSSVLIDLNAQNLFDQYSWAQLQRTTRLSRSFAEKLAVASSA